MYLTRQTNAECRALGADFGQGRVALEAEDQIKTLLAVENRDFTRARIDAGDAARRRTGQRHDGAQGIEHVLEVDVFHLDRAGLLFDGRNGGDIRHGIARKTHLNRAGLRLALEIEGIAGRLGACVGGDARTARLPLPLEGAKHRRYLRVRGCRIGVLLDFRAEGEIAELETAEVNLVDGVDLARPSLGGDRGSRRQAQARGQHTRNDRPCAALSR